jgi:SAM-dependent methyltransferase
MLSTFIALSVLMVGVESRRIIRVVRITEHDDAYGTYHDAAEGDRSFGDVLAKYFAPEDRATKHVLAIGCGVSRFYEEMALDGYNSILCVDNRHEARHFLETHWRTLGLSNETHSYHVGDLFEFLPIVKKSGYKFDMIIDKGVLELMGFEGEEKVVALFDNFHDILSEGGKYVQIGPFAPRGHSHHWSHESEEIVDDQGVKTQRMTLLDGTYSAWAPMDWPEDEYDFKMIGKHGWKMVAVESVKNSGKQGNEEHPFNYVYLLTPVDKGNDSFNDEL